ncbi:hypothetical protein BaRGS_00006958 [Batillaria attramentaria]|uniref:DED domain-containing protein n=1 Tax=Batillaria attramentaria TaxID=370345 RepID=A0ABD0LQY7_9CAEN
MTEGDGPCIADVIPSDDWELNVLLLKVAQALDDADFNKLKFLCTGRKGIPAGVLERLSTPEKLFTYLRQQKMISRDNLLLLQAFLWHVDRRDLHNMAADYARRLENGFQHIRFHVEGGLSRFQRAELEALRSQVSRLLFVPPEFVFLSGVEPAHSMTLTFMVHRNCEAPLPDLLRDHGESFSSLGVDRVWVEGQELFLKETIPIVMESKVEKNLCELFDRNKLLEEKVADQEVTLMKHQEQLHSACAEAASWQRRESYFRSLLARASEDDKLTAPVPITDPKEGTTHIIV